jgi:hypothetical protein
MVVAPLVDGVLLWAGTAGERDSRNWGEGAGGGANVREGGTVGEASQQSGDDRAAALAGTFAG